MGAEQWKCVKIYSFDDCATFLYTIDIKSKMNNNAKSKRIMCVNVIDDVDWKDMRNEKKIK